MLVAEMEAKLSERMETRCPGVIVPGSLVALPQMVDKDGNTIHNVVVYTKQIDDAIKAVRRSGFTARQFTYNQQKFDEEKIEKVRLENALENCKTELHATATDAHQELFIALMHFKVIRAYIDGVLRFGIPPRFWLGVIMPRKGAEKTILNEMMNALAEEGLKEMYGERN